MNIEQLFKEIDRLKEKLDKKRPLPKEIVKNLREHLLVEWTYHSNGIEGNTLTLSETKVILEDGITIGGRSMREHLEAINHKEAILFLEDILNENIALTEQTIKDIHAIILRGIDSSNAGVYRQVKVLISGATHIPPSPFLLKNEMAELMTWYHHQASFLHPVEKAALLHSFFVKIHPFIDGNGRTARLLLNLVLMKEGYLPIVIKKEQRLPYYEALDLSHVNGNHSPFITMIAENLKERFEFYLTVLN